MAKKPRFTGVRSEEHKTKAKRVVNRMFRRAASMDKDHHWIADQLGVAYPTVRRWANGRSLPWGNTFALIEILDADLKERASRSTHVKAGKKHTPFAKPPQAAITPGKTHLDDGLGKAPEPIQLEFQSLDRGAPVAPRVAVESFLRLDRMEFHELCKLAAEVAQEIVKRFPGKWVEAPKEESTDAE